MRAGKAFELLVKNILLHTGFSEVPSDGLYIFDGAPGQMIQGLAEAHNADVLLEPPVQTPFYTPTRLLIECKDYYTSKVGLGTVRSALGLREDINHFDIVDKEGLMERRSNRRTGIVREHQRVLYQVAIASMSGFTVPGQSFAATHRMPLIEFNKMPFWEEFRLAIGHGNRHPIASQYMRREQSDESIFRIVEEIAKRSAVAITDSGQLLFLYRIEGETNEFGDGYSLFWNQPNEPWVLRTGNAEYQFQLPNQILKSWLQNSATDLERRINAINYKAGLLSNMIVYFSEHGRPKIKMISIDRSFLLEAFQQLQ